MENHIEENKRGSTFKEVILPSIEIFTLLAFIIFSSIQSCQTKRALTMTDSANSLTKQSIELAEKNGAATDALNRSAIEIADSSMKLYKKLVGLQDRNSKAELRAYITIKSIEPFFEVGKKFIYNINVMNTGKTPAFKMLFKCNCKFGGKGVYDFEILNINTPPKMNVEYETIGNGLDGCLEIKNEEIMNFELYTNILSGKIDFYIYGFIFYNDIFGEAHKTAFCWRYFAERNTFYSYGKYNYVE